MAVGEIVAKMRVLEHGESDSNHPMGSPTGDESWVFLDNDTPGHTKHLNHLRKVGDW